MLGRKPPTSMPRSLPRLAEAEQSKHEIATELVRSRDLEHHPWGK
ncbi:hypothetical protein [Bradyrhizobium neotropicale]|nr:hypothetical protein [Bradyrhizobium neotropicale]